MKKKQTQHVVVLKGGWSAEREVSLKSGEACAKALRKLGYRVSEVDVKRDLQTLLDALNPKPDLVFNALHGRFGEDGSISAILDILRIPYTHSGLLPSALAMNKYQTKRLLLAAGIPFPTGTISDRETLARVYPIDPPFVVKPINEGSSVGVQIIRDKTSVIDWNQWQEDQKLLVEEFISGRELTVAVMGNKALGITELIPKSDFYDFEAKYTEGKTLHQCPALIDEHVSAKVMQYAELAHKTLGCRGISRSDFRYDDTNGKPGNIFMLEINTQPGMTSFSLVPEQAAEAGISFAGLVEWMVSQARFDN